MIYVKGVLIGVSLFGIAVLIAMYSFMRQSGPVFGSTTAYDVRTILYFTTGNIWFWLSAVACLILGIAFSVTTNGKFPIAFWVLLGVVDVVPAAVLGIFLFVIHRAHQIG